MPHLKLPGIIPLLPLAGLMHLVCRKEKKVCLEVVAALVKSGTWGSRRLGKTKTWENVRLQILKDVTVGLKVCHAYVCVINMIDREASRKNNNQQMASSPVFSILLRICSGGGITSSWFPLALL